jgi:ATP-dependent Clp protease protease subunit
LVKVRTRLEPSGGATGQASDVAIHAKEILRIRERLTQMYLKHCAMPGEDNQSGVKRFGSCILLPLLSELTSLSEKALERDYFMTGG